MQCHIHLDHTQFLLVVNNFKVWILDKFGWIGLSACIMAVLLQNQNTLGLLILASSNFFDLKCPEFVCGSICSCSVECQNLEFHG